MNIDYENVYDAVGSHKRKKMLRNAIGWVVDSLINIRNCQISLKIHIQVCVIHNLAFFVRLVVLCSSRRARLNWLWLPLVWNYFTSLKTFVKYWVSETLIFSKQIMLMYFKQRFFLSIYLKVYNKILPQDPWIFSWCQFLECLLKENTK